MRENWSSIVDGISEEEKLLEFILKKNKHPVEFLEELNTLYKRNRTEDAVRRKFYRMTGENISKHVSHPNTKLEDFGSELAYESLYPQYESLAARNKIYDAFDKKDHKILVMSDLEIPYQHTDYIRKAIRFAKKQGCTDLVIAGDFFHAYAFSKYIQDKDIGLKDEYHIATNFAREVKSQFNNVVFVMGNHDFRVIAQTKYRFAELSTQMEPILKDKNGDVLNVFCEEHGFLYSKCWWVQIGELIAAHRFPYSSVYGKNMTNTVDWFLGRIPKGIDSEWEEDDSLHVRPFRAVIQGHSHRVMSGGMYKQVYLYETGCMCREIDFNLRGSQTQPVWERAFGIVHLRNRKIQYNKSRIFLPKEM